MKVRIGFNQADWIIEKNGLGTPKARNKYCLIYGGNPASEDHFCPSGNPRRSGIVRQGNPRSDQSPLHRKEIRRRPGRTTVNSSFQRAKKRVLMREVIASNPSVFVDLNYPFLSSVNTCLATAFKVSKTPSPVVATASKTGSSFFRNS